MNPQIPESLIIQMLNIANSKPEVFISYWKRASLVRKQFLRSEVHYLGETQWEHYRNCKHFLNQFQI